MKRLRACYDACNAIDFLHQHKYIHRDLKAENFFVSRKNIIKLGDFGESTKFRSRESSTQKRMSILGTVAFMAPELIQANKFYTESIDIYALSITMWEIMTGNDPYAEFSQFQIYDKVMEGYRPTLPTIGPEGFDEILQQGWNSDYMKRPTSNELCNKLQLLISNLMNPSNSNDNENNNNIIDESNDVCNVSFDSTYDDNNNKSMYRNSRFINNIDVNNDMSKTSSSSSTTTTTTTTSDVNQDNPDSNRQSSRPTIVTLSRDGIKTFNPLFLASSIDSTHS